MSVVEETYEEDVPEESGMLTRKGFSELTKRYIIPLAFFVVLLLGWEFSVSTFHIPKFLLPAPTVIYQAFINVGSFLPQHLLITLQEILLGFALGSGIGTMMGIAIAYSRIMERIVYPLAVFVKVMPIIAIAPLLTVWFGFGIWSKVAVTVIISFFPSVVSTSVGLRSVDRELIYLLKSLSATERQTFFEIRLPWSFPHIFSALKIAITLSVVGAVVGEFVGATGGLGFMLTLAVNYVDTPTMFVILGVLAVIGVSLFALVVFIEKIVAPWTQAEEVKT